MGRMRGVSHGVIEHGVDGVSDWSGLPEPADHDAVADGALHKEGGALGGFHGVELGRAKPCAFGHLGVLGAFQQLGLIQPGGLGPGFG